MGVSVEREYMAEMYLTDTVWDDLRFPATAINPPGGAAAPAKSETDGLLYFSASATNLIAIAGQMPHGWKRGSTISPHIHVMHNDDGTGNSVWEFKYRIARINGTFTDYATDTKTFAAPASAGKHSLFAFDDIDMSDHPGTSTMILILLSRLGGNGADDYANTIALLEFDIHYQINKLGTRDEFRDDEL
jgi:hypothetical protein